MKRLLLSLCLFSCISWAGVSVYELPSEPTAEGGADSIPVEIADKGFITGYSFISPYGSDVGAPALVLIRESWTNATVVTPFAATNFTYSISFTNAVGVTFTNTAVRPYEAFPPTLTGYWTNENVRAWTETNWIPDRCASTTNYVVTPSDYVSFSGNSFGTTNGLRFGVVPGDRIFFHHGSDAVAPGERVTVWIED